MGLLKPADNLSAYLKMGLFGDTGSGKTWTAALVAIGLSKYLKSKKPCAIFDTEGGSSFIAPQFKASGIPLLVHNGSAVTDLSTIIDEAAKECEILIIDSITNVWDEFTGAYMRKKRQSYIELFDWKPIKTEWRNAFTVKFINSKLHIIMCGREGAVYSTEEVEKGGRIKKETIKSGVKMRAEAEVAFEPSLLCQMERVYLDGSAKYARRCNVVKERYGVIDSQTFDNPTFENFLPHIKLLNLGGEHSGVDATRTSEALFDSPDKSVIMQRQQKEICLEEIKNALTLAGLEGRSDGDKVARIKTLTTIFGTAANAAIEVLPLDALRTGLEKIRGLPITEKTK